MFRITADVEYLDGLLRGLFIPAGHSYTVPTQELAVQRVAELAELERNGDFIKATITGNRYRVSNPRVSRVQS